ncbi:unnamed protein product [Caenorhabditis sp. 36 PRJEB53466]|nr:unnamed protein product [Caenorhabditis sp. 36 PRJEB53466]
MQAKLFMIPWIIPLVVAQRVPAPTNAAPSTQALTNDLLVDAHQRHFYEMLRRQQQINDALLLNNALLHPHIPQLHIPTNPADQLIPPAPLFNPFIQQTAQGSTSKLGTYGKEEPSEAEKKEEGEKEVKEAEVEAPEEKEGTVEAPHRVAEAPKKTLAGVKTVSIQRKGEVAPNEEVVTTTAVLSEEDLEVVQLFKKLNLSKAETKSIVEHVEQVVREELTKKLKEAETSTTTTTTTTAAPTRTTTASATITPTDWPEEVTTTTSPIPLMRVRSEENLILQRNNLKHHPIKLQRKKLPDVLESEEVSQGSIKTSLTHLPIIVANEEEDASTQKATLHKRILIASQDREKESDRDLLVDFATGAPLDLTDIDAPKQRSDPTVVVSTLPTPSPTTTTTIPVRPMPQSLPPRQTQHEVTNFERLATDYRRRLEHTGDINKILQKISENAYISLVERGGSRKLFGI